MNRTYLIEALAPLVFRSGKPFGAQSGADGAAFPPPSSLAGLVRTLSADQAGETYTDSLKDIAVAGPLLAWRDRTGVIQALLPKPADAVTLQDGEGRTQVRRLAPGPLPASAGWDLADDLLPPLLDAPERGKAVAGIQYWPYPLLQRWLEGGSVSHDELQKQGLASLAAEHRTHVALNDLSRTAAPGRLFQTGGIDLAAQRLQQGWAERDLVLLARTAQSLTPTLGVFGGERRLSRLQPAQGWPVAPDGLEQSLNRAGGLKLTLATPAIYANGHLPGWLDPATLTGAPPGCPGLQLRLRSLALERWQPHSGWDLKENRPRAMRKAVPAGAVYWFEIRQPAPAGFAEALWFTPTSDHPQDRLDGFGLAIPAPWNPL